MDHDHERERLALTLGLSPETIALVRDVLHGGQAIERTLTAILNSLQTLNAKADQIMSELTELRDSVTELKKDSQRALDSLAATRQSLAEVQAALDALKTNTNLNDEDRAAVDAIKQMVTDTDTAIETAVPEVPAPPPPGPQ